MKNWLQNVDGVDVFVAVLPVEPKQLLPINADGTPELYLYAKALDTAIRKGEVSEPGKYGVRVLDSGNFYEVFKIIEPDD